MKNKISKIQKEGPLERNLLTVKEAAACLGLSEATVRDWIFHGKLPKVKLGRAVRISKDFLDRLIEQNTVYERQV